MTHKVVYEFEEEAIRTDGSRDVWLYTGAQDADGNAYGPGKKFYIGGLARNLI
jgi:hypothetical protein